jgi:hypothetical protein
MDSPNHKPPRYNSSTSILRYFRLTTGQFIDVSLTESNISQNVGNREH